MRRGVTLFVAIGLTVTGIGSSCAIRGQAHGTRPLGVRLAALATGGGARPPVGTKAVRFAGYQIDVPANWPVYRLYRDPTRCVRYDRHAVYLGQPGVDQQCPAHLVGRVATVSLQASTPGGGLAAAAVWHTVPTLPGLTEGIARTRGTVAQDAQDQELRAVVSDPALTVTATYGRSASSVATIIGSLRRVTQLTNRPGTTRQGPASRPPAPERPAPTLATPQTVTAPPAGRTASATRQQRQQPVRDGIAGFDTCTAPSLPVMQAWRPDYSAVAVYLGGPDAACGYGNLSPAWVQAVLRMGWSLIPAYVGPQAPCTSFRTRIRVGHARAEGQAAASDAIRLATALGLRRGAPIYDDMEWFNPSSGVCRRQVLSFLNGWTWQLHALGYRSGVYSSADSAVRDLGQTSEIYGQRLVEPNSIWFALWDGRPRLQGQPYLSARWWADRRIKQYQGAHRERIGGYTLSIDSDLVDGSVYR